AGTRVIMGTVEEQTDVRRSAVVIRELDISIFQLTPSRLRLMTADEKAAESLKKLKFLLVGGEMFPADLLEKVRQLTEAVIINLYGPTETTIWSTLKDVSGENPLTIGTPIANTRIYILSAGNMLQPVGVPGELFIAGAGLSRGYLNKPGLTAEKFLPSPFEAGQLMYGTGDIARWLPDGDIECLGRADHQVKIKGFRIEPGEIEQKIAAFEGIKEAVVIAREPLEKGAEHMSGQISDNVPENQSEQIIPGETYLCAYMLWKTGCDDNETALSSLREYLAAELPYYMIPAYFVSMEKFPLTPNGKIDRKKLPEPELKEQANHLSPPATETQRKLARLWSDILHMEEEKIGIDSDFFRLGGHSLKATVLATRIHKTFDTRVTLGDLFRTSTIRELGKLMEKAGTEKSELIPQLEESEYYRLSSAQKRLYIMQQMDTADTGYNILDLLFLKGQVDISRLESIFKKLIERHESFRTTFHMEKGEPVQKVQKRVEFVVEYFDLCSKSATGETTGDNLEEKTIDAFSRTFNLARAPLFRLGVIKKENNLYILMLDIHHIISDGVSATIILKDFTALYRNKPLQEINITYKDYARWQSRNLREKTAYIKKQETYWLNLYKTGVPESKLPTDYPEPAAMSTEAGSEQMEIPAETARQIKKVVIKEGITLYSFLMAAYSLLLSKYSGGEDLIVGTVVAGRMHADLQNIVGAFVNLLPIRNFPQGDKEVEAYLKETNRSALEAFENQDYPYEALIAALKLPVTRGKDPLINAAFTVQNMDMDIGHTQKDAFKIEPYKFRENKITNWILDLIAYETGDTVTLRLNYSSVLFARSTARDMLGHYMEIIDHFLNRRQYKLHEIKISNQITAPKTEIVEEEGDFDF
ncbi:MAG: AMP-binding protein, partial [bacterium]|nr:AMP-binding protein [bacterium]